MILPEGATDARSFVNGFPHCRSLDNVGSAQWLHTVSLWREGLTIAMSARLKRFCDERNGAQLVRIGHMEGSYPEMKASGTDRLAACWQPRSAPPRDRCPSALHQRLTVQAQRVVEPPAGPTNRSRNRSTRSSSRLPDTSSSTISILGADAEAVRRGPAASRRSPRLSRCRWLRHGDEAIEDVVDEGRHASPQRRGGKFA